MKKIVFVIGSLVFFSHAFAQDSLSAKKASTKKSILGNRPSDHFMLQLSSDHWAGMTDSMRTHQKGLSHGVNIYFMVDKPFRASPKYSVAFGVGVSTSNIEFKKMNVDLTSTTPELPFTALDGSNHFKRFKVVTGYAEVPVELRYSTDPSNPEKGWKAAIGARVGFLINAHTKGRILEDQNGATINTYTEKENSKRYINGTRLMATARIGYGIISLFGAFQVSSLLKQGAGPSMNLYQIGVTISGL